VRASIAHRIGFARAGCISSTIATGHGPATALPRIAAYDMLSRQAQVAVLKKTIEPAASPLQASLQPQAASGATP
jgi:hypothetical protein